MLQRTDELFIAREAAWALVSAYNVNLTRRQRLIIQDLREDIIQLLVQPTTCQRKDVLSDVESNFRSRLNRSAQQTLGIPLAVPGLRDIIAGGIFSTSRVWRFTTGILLSPWPGSEHVAGALADTLMQVPAKDYGLQRSIIRLITKIGSRGLGAAGQGLTSISTSDDSVRLSLAWALGGGSDPGDEKILSDLYDNSHDRITKRAICVAARRRQFALLLQRFSQAADSAVSGEARIALAALRELLPRDCGPY